MQGWLRNAFTLAFAFLQIDRIDFKEAMRRTLTLGGDTDTNCCIVGGLMGAAVGAEEIPYIYRKTLLECNILKGKQPKRPDFVQPAKSFNQSF